MYGSASEGQESATEGIFVESPLSFFLLEGLLEIRGGGLEDAGLGPVGEQIEQIAQVAPRLDAMEFAAGDQRGEGGVGGAPSSEPTKSQFLRPTASFRRFRSETLLVIGKRPSSRKRSRACC